MLAILWSDDSILLYHRWWRSSGCSVHAAGFGWDGDWAELDPTDHLAEGGKADVAFRWGDVDAKAIVEQHGDWLAPAEGEQIEFAAKTVRDLGILTDRRLVRAGT